MNVELCAKYWSDMSYCIAVCSGQWRNAFLILRILMSSNVKDDWCIVLPMNCGQLFPVWYRNHEFGELFGMLETFSPVTRKDHECSRPTGETSMEWVFCNCTMCTIYSSPVWSLSPYCSLSCGGGREVGSIYYFPFHTSARPMTSLPTQITPAIITPIAAVQPFIDSSNTVPWPFPSLCFIPRHLTIASTWQCNHCATLNWSPNTMAKLFCSRDAMSCLTK